MAGIRAERPGADRLRGASDPDPFAGDPSDPSAALDAIEPGEPLSPQVRAVAWDHWSDADPHLTPNGGLVDAHGRPQPLLARLRALRAAHLA